MSAAGVERWKNQVEYFLSSLGYAVGIGNVWRFPYMCYRNGGGAFLIPYFLTAFICGIPLVYLETTLGQFASVGCISIFNLSPLFKGAGYAIVILNVISVVYFCSLMAYAVLYFYHSFTIPLPWEHCGNPWNTESCTEITGNSSIAMSFNETKVTTPADEFFYIKLLRVSRGLDEIGGVVWPVFWSNMVCWVLVYCCICNGVKGVGKIVYFTVLFPYVVLSVLLARGLTLPGAWEGVIFYILPDWNQLRNPKVWVDAATQVFYSLGPGWGGLVSMASFNHFHFNTLRSSIFLPIVNGATSIWAGFVVFSVLGFAATRAGVPVSRVATAGPSLVYVTYPTAISMMPVPNVWAVLFFFMLFLLGIDTMFVTIESVIAGVLDEFPMLRPRKRIVTFVSCVVLFLLSILCNTEGGLHIVSLMDSHVALIVVPAVCLLELVAATYSYGPRRLAEDVLFMTGTSLHPLWMPIWRYIVPAILIVITYIAMREIVSPLGWAVATVSVVCIPLVGGYMLYSGEGTLKQRVRKGCMVSPAWGPADPAVRQRWIAARAEHRLKRAPNIELAAYN